MSEIPVFFQNILTLSGALSLLLKVIGVIFVIISFMILLQIRLMTDSLKTNFTPLFYVLGIVQFVAAVIMCVISFLVLS